MSSDGYFSSWSPWSAKPANLPRGGVPRAVPKQTALYKNISSLATLNAQLGDIRNAAIFVRGNVIEWVGPTALIPAQFVRADRVVDLTGRVVIPGMVNTHHHMIQCLTRCVAIDSQLFGWLTTLYPAWAYLEGEDVHAGAKLAMVELIMSGCTTSSDHLYIYPNDVKLDDTIRAARELGMRFHPSRGAMTLGASKGGLPPDKVCEEEEPVLLDMERVIKEFHDATKYSMLRIVLAPCSPFTVTDSLMKRSAVLARQYPEVRLHTHLAENQEDIDYSLKTYGCRPGQYIKNVGWSAPDVWFAHCCMLNKKEMQQFSQNKIGIAHCPSSNLRLASGIANVRELVDTGVNVGMGVDGSASNDCGSMIAEARLACLLQRRNGNPEGMRVREALTLAVKGGARNLGRDDIGEIAPGMAADFVGWRTDALGFIGCGSDEIAGLILCTPSIGSVDLSVINGEVVVKDGKLITADMNDVIAKARKASDKIRSHLPIPVPHS